MVEEENNQSRMYFGRCIAFFEDANDQILIGVRWYEAADVGDSLIDPIVHLLWPNLNCHQRTTAVVTASCQQDPFGMEHLYYIEIITTGHYNRHVKMRKL
jgi:hypothetical protein